MNKIFDTWVFGDKRAWMIFTVISHSDGLNLNEVSKHSGVEYKAAKRLVERLENEGLIIIARVEMVAKRKSPIYQGYEMKTPNGAKPNAEPGAKPFSGNNRAHRAETPNLEPNPEPNPPEPTMSRAKPKTPFQPGVQSENAEPLKTSPPLDNMSNKTKTKKGRLKYREKPLAELKEFHEKVLHIYETICFNSTNGKEAIGNYGKTIGLIKKAYSAGYKNLREYEASMKFWYTLDGDWESGHKMDRWAADIPNLIERAKKAGLLRTKAKPKDMTLTHRKDTERLKEMGLYDPDKDPLKK